MLDSAAETQKEKILQLNTGTERQLYLWPHKCVSLDFEKAGKQKQGRGASEQQTMVRTSKQ